MNVYVIMKERQSPIYIALPKPHEVQLTLKAAQTRVKELNEKSVHNHYWHTRVPFIKAHDEVT